MKQTLFLRISNAVLLFVLLRETPKTYTARGIYYITFCFGKDTYM